MRKVKFLSAVAIFAVMFISTSCVDNEESESVKALRMAQAGLIEAKTNQTNLEASATALFDSIQAEMQMAELRVEQARANYEEADYENEQTLLQLELEEAQMDQQRLIAEAEARMKEAEKELEVAIRELEAEIAASEVSNPALDEYLSMYKEAVNQVQSIREDILDRQKEIAEARLHNDYEDEDSSMIALILQQKERELATLEEWKTKYEEVVDDPSSMSTALNDAKASLQESKSQVESKDREVTEAEIARDEAVQVYNDALTDYNDATADSTEIYQFTYDVGMVMYPKLIPGEYLEEILNDPNHGGDQYYSIEYYDDQIDSESDEAVIEELEEDKSVVESYINMLNNEYGGNIYTAIDDLKDAYFAAKDSKEETQDTLDELNDELSQLQGEEANAETFVTALEGEYDGVITELDNIDTNIENLNSEITEIENNVESWTDWIGFIEEDLANLEEELEIHQTQVTDYKQLIDQELSEE